MSLHRPVSLLTVVLLAVAAAAIPAVPAVAGPACPTNGIPFTSTLSNGKVKIGRLDPATGAAGTACGVVDFTPELTLEATIPQANLAFEPLSVPIDKLGLIDVEVRIRPASDFTGPVTFGADGIHIALSGDVVAEADVLLNTCTIGPFRTSLTTDQSGSLTGAPFAGADPASLTGKLVGNEGRIPRANRTWRCPIVIADIFDAITGLPSPSGESWLTFDGALTLSPAAAALRG
jgi:hypothetical protein